MAWAERTPSAAGSTAEGRTATRVLRRRPRPRRQQTGRDPRGAVDASGVQSGAGEPLGDLIKEGFCLG